MRVVSTLSFHLAVGRVLLELGSATARHIHSQLLIKYLTDWDICNEAYSVIVDEGDISFHLQVFDLTDEAFRLFYQWACVS